MKIKFDEPIKTKSGRSIIELWNNLKLARHKYQYHSSIEKDNYLRIHYAVQVRYLQDDLKMTQTNYPEIEQLLKTEMFIT